MTIFRISSAGLLALAVSAPAAAQSVLDRTDPTQEEEQEQVERLDDRGESPAVPITTEPAPDPIASARRYDVGAIVVDGAQALDQTVFLPIVAEYSARSLDAAQLEELTRRIAERARQDGYVFATAWIEPQSLGSGVLRIRLDEGTIDAIRIEGADDRAIRAQLQPLVDGRPATLARVERQLLLADDISGAYVRRTRFVREGDTGVLVVEAYRSDFSGRIELENDGSQPIGPERGRVDFDANGLVSPFDELDLTLSTTPFQPSELQYIRGRYALVVGSGGTEISADGSYSATEPGAYLADDEVFGDSWRVGAAISHPLLRSRDASLWWSGEVELRDLRQEREGVLYRHDRLPVGRTSLYSLARLSGGRLRAKLTVSRGLDIFDATDRGDPLASREDASAEFITLSGWIDWERELPSDFSLALAGRGQLASDPLLITEDIGLGGTRFLRGYNFSERSGDEGIMGYGELRYDWNSPLGLFRNMQLYAFADGGVVGNLKDGRGGGSLASSGGGLRTDITRDLDIDLEIAVPLTGPRYDTDNMAPRFNFRISHSL